MTRSLTERVQILSAVTRIELAKRYSGSVLGKVWIVLYPLLLLSIYLFVYLVVFKVQFAGGGPLQYALFVFSGLIPYIGFMEAMSTGCLAIKQNIHLINNVMLPIELVPVRYVLVSMVGQVVGLGILILLVIVTGSASPRLLGLPLMLALQLGFLIGLLWIIAPLAAALPDLAHLVNLCILFLMFVSPIGFRPEMVPMGAFRFVLLLNPIYYMVEAFRLCLLREYQASSIVIPGFAACALLTCAAGHFVFSKFKSVVADYE
jgi:lipopolysaccharide transport system permease protein